jgi:hypothetical protein
MTLDRLSRPSDFHDKSYDVPFNDSLLLNSKNLELMVIELSNQLETLKRVINPQYDKFTYDLEEEFQLDSKNLELLGSYIVKGNSISMDYLPDSLRVFRWKIDYLEILHHPIKRIFVLIAIENMKLELKDYQRKILDYYLSMAKLPPFEVHYRIDMDSKVVQVGDTFNAVIYPLSYHKLKSAIVNGKTVSVDSSGIGHFSINAKSIQFWQNGSIKNTFHGIFNFDIGKKDTSINSYARSFLGKN